MRTNRHEWLADPLLGIEGAVVRTMFGCRSVYARGRLLLVLADGEPPWNGCLFPVERENHAAILQRWPMLREHPVLPKWLYLPETAERFEFVAQELVREIQRGHPLLGVVPPKKKRRTKKPAAEKAVDKAAGDAPAGGAAPGAAEHYIPPHLR